MIEAPGVDFSFVNNTDVENPRIFRMEGIWGYLLVDPETGMFAVLSSQNNLYDCNASFTVFSFMEEQAIFHDPDAISDGMINTLVLGRGIYIGVFDDYPGWAAAEWSCDGLYERMLAEGTGNLTETDNDYYSYLRPSNNANAFGYTANGLLETAGGDEATFHGVSRCVWDGNDPATQKCGVRINYRERGRPE